MPTTERQERLLNTLTQEYIKSAKPVSSEFLEKKCKLGVCPATIRNEMQELTEMGYLFQPHTSAGRVPTDKGYRFFVDRLMEMHFENDLFFRELGEIEKETEDIFKFIETVTKNLASASSGLALAYLFGKDFFWKDGWGGVFQNPEFKEIDFVEDFIKTVENFERNIKDFVSQKEDLSGTKIYIGKEKSILNSKDFSLIISESKFPQNEQGLLAILGPKRMAYDKNISLINSLIKELESF